MSDNLALKAIADMKVNEGSDTAALVALCQAIARIELDKVTDTHKRKV